MIIVVKASYLYNMTLKEHNLVDVCNRHSKARGPILCWEKRNAVKEGKNFDQPDFPAEHLNCLKSYPNCAFSKKMENGRRINPFCCCMLWGNGNRVVPRSNGPNTKSDFRDF